MVVVRGGCAAARALGPGERICAPAAADAGRAPGRGAPRFAAGEENMETSYRELKCKDVVNVADGRNLGRTCDIVFTFPEGQVFGIAVPGKRGLHLFKKNDLFISLRNIVKIGADVVLVDLKNRKPDCPPGKGRAGYADVAEPNFGKRDFSEYE